MLDYIDYAKKWLKRPIFQGLDQDKLVLQLLINEIENSRSCLTNPIAWAKTNSRGDLYDLRLQYNPYESNVIPLYLGINNGIKR